MSVDSRFRREALIYLGGSLGVGLIQFLALPIYARYLGPAQYGLFSLTMATTTLLAGVMLIGGDVALARFWADLDSKERQRQLASTWIGFLTVWSIIIALLACLLAPWVAGALRPDSDLSTLLIIGYLALIPTQLGRMLSQVLRNTFRPVAFAGAMLINATLNVSLGLLLAVVFDLGVYGVLLGILIGECLGSVIRFLLVRSYLAVDFSPSILGPLLRFGAPLVPATVATWAFKGADRLVLSANVGADELGYYALAVSLVGPFAMVTGALGQAWIPRIAQLHVQDRTASGATTSRAILYALAGFGAGAMAVGALAPLLVGVIGGPEYAEGAEALPLLALGAVFAAVSPFAATGLTLEKKTGIIPVVAVAAGVVDVGLLFVLVPRYGLVGAAAAVALAYFCKALAMLYFANRVYPIAIDYRRAVPVVVVLVLQSAVCTWWPEPWLVALTTAAGAVTLFLGVGGLRWIRSSA